MAELGKREITSLIIEGGAMVNWAALSAGVVDKIFFYYAPKILAGTGSILFALGAGYRHMSEAASVKSLTLHRFGEDFAVEGYLRDPTRTRFGWLGVSNEQLAFSNWRLAMAAWQDFQRPNGLRGLFGYALVANC